MRTEHGKTQTRVIRELMLEVVQGWITKDVDIVASLLAGLDVYIHSLTFAHSIPKMCNWIRLAYALDKLDLRLLAQEIPARQIDNYDGSSSRSAVGLAGLVTRQ